LRNDAIVAGHVNLDARPTRQFPGGARPGPALPISARVLRQDKNSRFIRA
jgi:hypothetical protein